jgi:hypothetical protein
MRRVNKICCSCSQDVLYRDIRAETHRVHQTLAESIRLARNRTFNSCYNDPDFAAALRNMTSLCDLKILVVSANSNTFEGCTFKLYSLTCFYPYDEYLRTILNSQPRIQNVTFITNDHGTRVDRRDIPTQFYSSRCHVTLAPLPNCW